MFVTVPDAELIEILVWTTEAWIKCVQFRVVMETKQPEYS